MKWLRGLAALILFFVLPAVAQNTSTPQQTENPPAIVITRSDSQLSSKGPAENFTGSVTREPLFEATPPSRTLASRVTFAPGARTAWHSHPFGQHLIVTSGTGWIQQWGGPIQEIRPGDVVWIPAGQKHWHGATATTAMTHIAIQEQLEGKTANWMENVSDEQYRAGATGKTPKN
jgi:quercetin dioxygenase-like cupin family protein